MVTPPSAATGVRGRPTDRTSKPLSGLATRGAAQETRVARLVCGGNLSLWRRRDARSRAPFAREPSTLPRVARKEIIHHGSTLLPRRAGPRLGRAGPAPHACKPDVRHGHLAVRPAGLHSAAPHNAVLSKPLLGQAVLGEPGDAGRHHLFARLPQPAASARLAACKDAHAQ